MDESPDLDLISFLITYGLYAVPTAMLFWLLVYMTFSASYSSSSNNNNSSKSVGRPGGRQLPPGPAGLAGMVKFLRGLNKMELHLTATEWARQYGDIVACNIFGKNIIFLNSAEISRRVFGEEFGHVCSDRPRTFSGKYIFFNCQDACMSPYNNDTKRMRKALHASLRFYGDGVQKFESTVHCEIDHIMAKLREGPGVVQDQDFENLVSDSILSIIHILLTGSRPADNDPHVTDMREFDHWFSALLIPDIDLLLQVAPWLRHFPCRAGQLWSLADGYKKKFLGYYFHHMKATYNAKEQRGLVDVLLSQQQLETDQWLTDDRIQCLLLNIVTGAYLTTRSSLLGCLLFLVHYPDVQMRAQKEIDEVVGQRKCRFEDKLRMPYLDAIVMETLRILSQGALGIPRCNREDITVNGYTIPKNSTLFCNMWHIHHDEKQWGDPWTFRPERFLDDQGQPLSATHPVRLKFAAFGLGRRHCPGDSFARARLFMYLVTLLQTFDFRSPPGVSPPPYAPGFIQAAVILQPPKFAVQVTPRQKDAQVYEE